MSKPAPHICVVVAHPDDEALWFGGGLLRLRDSSTSVVCVCLTNAANVVRAAEFRELCRRVHAVPVMLDYPDGGHAQLPQYPAELDALFAEHEYPSVVVTHSPLGQERGHPQHVQCWHAVRRWTDAHTLPLAFFAERPLPELIARGRTLAEGPGVRVRRAGLSAWWVLRSSGRMLREVLSDRLAFDRLREAVRERRLRFAPVSHVVEIDVDAPAKAELMDAYPSQLAGLAEYAAFMSDREYVYALGGCAAERLQEAFACHSS
jgi:LmbE family N-acetylglucosaminyl deacetylase